MMEYFNRSADMGLPIEEDTLFYNFEVEFECVLENGKRCITDEKVAHRHGEIAGRLHEYDPQCLEEISAKVSLYREKILLLQSSARICGGWSG